MRDSRSEWFRGKFAYLFLLLCVLAPAAQAQSGLIQGVVMDPANAVIVQAKVVAIDETKGILVREAMTAQDGAFQLRPLMQGTYTVRVEAPGFQTLEQTGLVLDAGQVMNLGDVRMTLGNTSSSVTIEATIPMVETTTAEKGYVVTSEQISELSLNGRDFGSLLLTLPGVATSAQSDFRLSFSDTTSFNVNGSRSSMNNVMLDGTFNTDVGDNGSQYTQPSLDAVGEFKVSSSGFAAENGRAGVIISASTKAGGQHYHGGFFYFGRNNFLDARPPFDITGKKTKLQFHQFGGNIGGPIYIPHVSTKADPKMFFFFNHETTRGIKPNGGQFVDIARPELLDGNFALSLKSGTITGTTFQNGTVFVPGSIVRNANGNITGGTPFPGNIVPKSMWSKNAAAFLKIMNAADRSFSIATPNAPEQMRIPLRDVYRLRKNQDILRLDYHVNTQTNVFFRWSADKQHEETGLGIWAGTPFPVVPAYREKPGANWSVNFVKMGPSIINEFVFAYSRNTQVLDVPAGADTALYDRDKLGFTYSELFPKSNLRNRFPNFYCGIGSCNFLVTNEPWENAGRDFNFTDNVTKIRGSHTFKAGAYFNLDDKQQQPNWNDSGTFDFRSSSGNPFDTNNGMANLLTGYYSSFQQTNGRFYGDFRYIGLEGYGQDTWKLGRRVTLEMGARYTYYGPTYTRNALLQNYWSPTLYDPAKAVTINTANGPLKGSIVAGSGNPFNGLIEENSAGLPSGFGKHRKNQVSPRFGFAWSPGSEGKTSVRGGFGTFFERMRQNQNNFNGLGNPPLVYTPSLFSGNIDSMGPELVSSGVRFPVSVYAFNQDLNTPTIYSWSFGIQRQLSRTISVEAAYVGNVARHLQYVRDLNQLPLGTTTAPGNTVLPSVNNVQNAARPYKGFTNVTYTDFGANSSYNSLQLRASRRFSKTLTMNVNYTWSKALDIVDADTNSIGYYLDRNREWGPAGFDRTHVLGIDYVYYMPRFARGPLNHKALRGALNGWQLSGVVRGWSGLPLTITSNGNAGTLGSGIRADYLGGDPYPEQQDRNNYFNPLIFYRPADGSLGNTGKGILRGPGMVNFDTSLFKNFAMGEGRNLQFRLETFNTLNHTEWYGVNTSVSASNPGQPVTAATRGTSGQITSTRDPRNVQLSMKLYW